MKQAFEFDVRMRIEDDKAPSAGSELRSSEVRDGVVYESDGVRVTAFEVDHRPVAPAFGYRVDYAGRSVVLSGDTRPSPNLIKFAQGVDLLIHEVADGSDRFIARNPGYRVVLEHHTQAEEAGKIFNTVKPQSAVYSHIVITDLTDAELVLRTRQSYSGPLVIGEDLARFVVTPDDVIVFRR